MMSFAGSSWGVSAASEFYHLLRFSRWVKKECSFSTALQHLLLMALYQKVVVLEMDLADFLWPCLIDNLLPAFMVDLKLFLRSIYIDLPPELVIGVSNLEPRAYLEPKAWGVMFVLMHL